VTSTTGAAAAGAGQAWASLPDAVLDLDVSGRVVAVNPAACRLTGYSASGLVGRRCAETLAARDSYGHRLLDDGWHPSSRLRSVRHLPEQAVVLRRADGRDVTAAVTGRYRRSAGGLLEGVVLCLRPEARRAPWGASGIEIVSTVSHELRSPLTSVKGYTSLLLNRWDRLDDAQKKMMLEQVHHDADRVTRLITELLDISRLESGRLVPRRQLIDLAALTARVVDKVGMEYPDLEATIRFADGFPQVYADPDKVEQVVTNLVENACKYASRQGLRISGQVHPGEISVEVDDRGQGIPVADLPRVFTKFFRREDGKPTGSGLGLWISRGLVQAHGGRLTADAVPGQGSTFRFTLPLIDLDRLQET